MKAMIWALLVAVLVMCQSVYGSSPLHLSSPLGLWQAGTEQASACLTDTTGTGHVDAVDVPGTVKSPGCLSYLPLITSQWRQPRTEISVLCDEFVDPTLQDWQILNEDSTHWSLAVRPHYLRVVTQYGTLNNARNVFLWTPSTADFSEISSRTEIEAPVTNHNRGGIIVYQDDYNYVLLVRDYTTGQRVLLVTGINGILNPNPAVETNLIAMELRIVKSGNLYTGYFRGDQDGDWIDVGQIWTPLSNIRVGLIAYGQRPDAPEVAVDFDNFCLAEANDEAGNNWPSGENPNN